MFTTSTLKFTTKLIFGLIFILIASPSFAGLRQTSKDGNLTIQTGDHCSTKQPSGSYKFKNGRAGTLTPIDCDLAGGDYFYDKFIDTKGKERCYGRLSTFWGYKTITIWEFQGAVSGYRCSQVGSKIEIEMNNGQ
ncbi:MAG: hypothetical protein IM507_07870 [Microcystis sp. M20BS1]|uniref:hypothetical protein n=1 Tax=Microcystis TaxID=1125 RepID=UPI0011CE89FB|nr:MULTISPECIES: hypothetical protein [Microcystis]MCA2623726.1 hypothetical protein [Microcystis sp. M19BS1]MCA2632307.1 hypothetical protein [Microcystis sp. M20BS1]